MIDSQGNERILRSFQNIMLTFPEAGNYTVKVIVKNEAEVTASFVVPIQVLDSPIDVESVLNQLSSFLKYSQFLYSNNHTLATP